jgi:hypothetical protein
MGDFVTEAFTLLAVAIVIIGLRTVARWIMVGPRNFQADDYLMLLACVRESLWVFLHLSNALLINIGGVWVGNRRCIHGGRMVQRPRQQCHDR